MTIEHKNIQEAGLHEPKGVSLAAANTVYVADGLGSGAWTGVSAPDKTVLVKSEDDMPEAVGGVAELEPNVTYEIEGDVTLNNRYTSVGNNAFVGNYSGNTSLTFTTTGDCVTFTDTTIFASQLTINAPNATALFKGSGQVANVDRATIQNCVITTPTVLDVDNIAVVVSTTNFNNVTSGIKLSGSDVIVLSLFKVFMVDDFDPGSVCIDLGTTTFSSVELTDLILVGAGTGILGLTNSGNLLASGIGSIDGGDFANIATPLSGVTNTDAQWEIAPSNSGVEPSKRSASGHAIGNAVTTTFAGTGIGNAVKVNLGTNFIAGDQNTFTVDNTGTYTYLGEKEKTFYTTFSTFGEVVGGASRQYVFLISVDGVLDESSSSKNEYDGSSPGSANCSTEATLCSGCTIELWVYPVTSATALTIDTVSGKVV